MIPDVTILRATGVTKHGYLHVSQKWILLYFFIILLSNQAFCQNNNYIVLTPEPNSIVNKGNLFVSVVLTPNIKFSDKEIKVLIDKTLVKVIPRINQNKLTFLYENSLPDGKHHIEIFAKTLNEPSKYKIIEWFFFVNINTDSTTYIVFDKNHNIGTRQGIEKLKQYSFSGSLFADNRSEFLNGSGQALRQEPIYTRTLSFQALARCNNAQIPIRFFTTTDNYSQIQNRDFFQVGFVNKWMDISYGDINPMMDRLVLSGVRMRGVKAKLMAGGSSVQLYYGEMNSAVEGSVHKYVPGSGYIPPNFINDSVYKIPGTYKRMMMAGRFELGNKREHIKWGIHAFKAKDDINSIQHGLAPKDNIAAGSDLTFKLFKRSLVISFGAAVSAITNDISYGVANKAQIDTTFNTHLPYDPADYKDYLIMNSSTVPIIPKNFDYGAYFGSLAFTNKVQSFSLEYRRNGPQFFSLGNPLLRNNYEGYVVGERIWFWRKRLMLNGNYQDFSNDLNQSLIATMKTNIINGSMFFTYKNNWPNLVVNYMVQNRNAKNAVISLATVDDRMEIFLTNLNYSKKFWGINHNFRLIYNQTKREDYIRPESATRFYNAMFGLTENFTDFFYLSLDAGKTMVYNYSNQFVSDINTYNGSLNWQNKKGIRTSISMANSINWATVYTNQTQRFSVIARFGFKFFRTMGIDMEYGYQPFKDETNSINNYQEQYGYIRYTYDFDFR